ncbi:MAG: antitoxin [Actinobacteria bacterium]|nr:antitoxin [Actinomycetota bacterium]
MRTTVTLDPDTRLLVERTMRERGLSFKAAVNEGIRRGLSPRQTDFSTPTFRMGAGAGAALTKALQVAGELEDDELARKLASRK